MNEPRKRQKLKEACEQEVARIKKLRDLKLAREIAIEIYIGANVHSDINGYQDQEERIEHLSAYAVDAGLAFVEKWNARTIQNEQ